MYTILFKIGTVTVYSWWLMLIFGWALASLAGFKYLVYLRKTKPKERWQDLPTPAQCVIMVLFLFIFGIIGAKLAYVLLHLGEYINEPMKAFNLVEGAKLAHKFPIIGLTSFRRKN